jgi:hypothetical protein
MENDLKARWQSQPTEGAKMSREEIRVQAERFLKRMRKTYNREYIAAVTMIIWMAAYAWFLKPVLFRVAAGLAIPAILLMLYQLRKRASPARCPQNWVSRRVSSFFAGNLNASATLGKVSGVGICRLLFPVSWSGPLGFTFYRAAAWSFR